MTGNGHAGFGRGTLEKGQTAPRPRPTSAVADAQFGLGFSKLCAYFPYPAKMWVNGHEWAKRQALAEHLAFTELANGFASCPNSAHLQAICDRLGPADLQDFFERWMAVIPTPLAAADRAAGYWWELSLRQVETARTLVSMPHAERARSSRRWSSTTSVWADPTK